MFCCIASTLQFSFSCVGHPYISSVHYPGISILKTVRVKQKVANVVSLKRSRFLRNSHHIGQLIMTIVCTDPSRVRNSNGKLHIILSVGNFFASHNELRGIRTHGISSRLPVVPDVFPPTRISYNGNFHELNDLNNIRRQQ